MLISRVFEAVVRGRRYLRLPRHTKGREKRAVNSSSKDESKSRRTGRNMFRERASPLLLFYFCFIFFANKIKKWGSQLLHVLISLYSRAAAQAQLLAFQHHRRHTWEQRERERNEKERERETGILIEKAHCL